MPLQPVVRSAVTVLVYRLGVACFRFVKRGSIPQDFLDAPLLRAMRVIRGFDLGVMLSVYRRPFLGDHASSEPQPESEEMTDDGMEIERPVGLLTMEKDRDAGDSDVGQDQRDEYVTPPR